jgi:hypothetical protein
MYNAEDLSKSAKNSFLSAPEEKLAKSDRLDGKGYSISEAKTGLTQTGEDKAGRIVFGKNDAGETIIKDGRIIRLRKDGTIKADLGPYTVKKNKVTKNG